MNPVKRNAMPPAAKERGAGRRPLPRVLTYAALITVSAAAFSATGAAAAKPPELSAPGGLQTFLRSANTSRVPTTTAKAPTFPRTPAFAWNPVRGATSYRFQLSTRHDFLSDSSLLWSSSTSAPAASVPLALPWITGDPASLFWRVRADGPQGPSQWSTPRAFNMRWLQQPRPLPAGPGFVRWSTVDGATGYQVWFLNTPGRKTFSTITNVADEREYYLPGKQHSGPVRWRVRAERQVYGGAENGLPAVSYGPWSPVFTSVNPAQAPVSPLRPLAAVSDVVSKSGHPKPHTLVPALAVNGVPSTPGNLYRAYVFTDRDCVNRVFTGYPVSGPAYAPRSYGGQALKQGTHLMADGTEVKPTELVRDGSGPAKIDLWDTAGRYYAVAVPVVVQAAAPRAEAAPQTVTTQTITSQPAAPQGSIFYEDVALPQDVCAKGRFLTFGKVGRTPTPTSGGHPTATGLSPNGRLLTAVSPKPRFFGSPLVTWEPASGAVGYQVQWSKTEYPWRSAGSIRTAATSAVLPLEPGLWWYRVRGINNSLRGSEHMTWSVHVPIVSTRPTLTVTAAPAAAGRG